jgi:hypothetical protein
MLGAAVWAVALAGCAHPKPPEDKPTMSPGNGAIAGKLVGSEGAAFDLSLAGEGGAEALKIELTSPSTGVVAATYPHEKSGDFIFSDVKPGTYELAVYRVVPGTRTIAGSQPVTVDPNQITPATVTLQVTPFDAPSH